MSDQLRGLEVSHLKKRGSVLPTELPLHMADMLLALQLADDAPFVCRFVFVFPKRHVGNSDVRLPACGACQIRTDFGHSRSAYGMLHIRCGHRHYFECLGIDDR